VAGETNAAGTEDMAAGAEVTEPKTRANAPSNGRQPWGARPVGTWVVFICSIGLVFERFRHGYEALWNPVSTMMFHPGKAPVFAHRLLFVGVAWVFRLINPALKPLDCYFLSQIVALVWTFSMVGLLVREAVGIGTEYAAYPLLALMFMPTFGYFTFYDIGLVGFFAACLYCLLRGRERIFLVIFAIGLFNHENLLLMAPVAVLFKATGGDYRRAFQVAASTLAIYGGSRLVLQLALPSDRQFDLRLAENLHPLNHYSVMTLLTTFAALLLPLCCVAVGFRYSHRLLRLAAPVVLLGLAAIVELFGQWHEPRQFDAMFGLAVPMFLSSAAGRTAARGTWRELIRACYPVHERHEADKHPDGPTLRFPCR
jgi:hypothetical protein